METEDGCDEFIYGNFKCRSSDEGHDKTSVIDQKKVLVFTAY